MSKCRPYACSLAIRKSWGIQSNAFHKSFKTAPEKRLLCNACLQFSISRIKTWFILYLLLYADISSDNERFMKRRSCSFKIFSNTFEKQFKMLMFYFISVIFSKIGLAEASFAESEKALFERTLLIVSQIRSDYVGR